MLKMTNLKNEMVDVLLEPLDIEEAKTYIQACSGWDDATFETYAQNVGTEKVLSDFQALLCKHALKDFPPKVGLKIAVLISDYFEMGAK